MLPSDMNEPQRPDPVTRTSTNGTLQSTGQPPRQTGNERNMPDRFFRPTRIAGQSRVSNSPRVRGRSMRPSAPAMAWPLDGPDPWSRPGAGQSSQMSPVSVIVADPCRVRSGLAVPVIVVILLSWWCSSPSRMPSAAAQAASAARRAAPG